MSSSQSDTLLISILSYRNITDEMSYVVDYNPYIGVGPFYFHSKEAKGLYCDGDRFLRFRLKFKRDTTWVTKLDSVYVPAFVTFRDTIYF